MRLKAKFRPNLVDAGNRTRLRRISGGDPAASARRNRTVSGSSNASSSGITNPPPPRVVQPDLESGPKAPPAVHRVTDLPPDFGRPGTPQPSPVKVFPDPARSPMRHPSQGDKSSPENIDPLKRQRRPTETREGREILPQPASVFDRRKADHKKKFNNGIPERNKMTMFDLIYYNPSDGSRMSTSSSRRASRASASSDDRNRSIETPVPEVSEDLDSVRKRLEEEAVDDVDEVDEKMPVPRVKVGPNNEIILDEESTLIETTAAKKAKEDLLKSPLVFENGNQCTNYGTWTKKKKSQDWSTRETLRFYKALSIFGTDFSMMASIFKKRSRQELKLKFKKEERQNRTLVDRCLKERMQFDTSLFGSDSDEEQDLIKGSKRRRAGGEKKKIKRKRVRKTKGNRGYYSSSDDADESEAGNSESSSSTRASISKEEESMLKSLLSSPKQQPATATLSEHSSGASITSTSLLGSPSMVFPPGLLAANPDLAKAMPGSLVVVASPAENDPQRQMLHIYRVASEQEKSADEKQAGSVSLNDN